MPGPANREEFFDLVRRSQVLESERLDTFARSTSDFGPAQDQPPALAARMVRDGLLTTFQARQLLQGKWRRFLINNKYKLMELIGSGGMGSVYLCEHRFMRRLVALKVLPVDKLDEPGAIERFYREARAVGALDHVNIVRAYDIDQDEKLHYLVMEYVDGASLQELIARRGPMDPIRAAHYTRQAALGLQHAHEAGLVHRDIKPGNLLLDRSGTIKILDLGLARFFNAHKDNVTEKFDDKAILGTADYLAPEQALGSNVDIRADIYGLGGTFYFLLTGKAPFEDGTITQKLLWHQTRAPKSVREIRADVPEGLAAVLEKMMAKAADDRFTTPAALAEALKPWTDQPIPAPVADEFPVRSPASLAPGSQGGPLLPATPIPRLAPSAILDRNPTDATSSAPRSPVRPEAPKSTARNTLSATATGDRVVAPVPPPPPPALALRNLPRMMSPPVRRVVTSAAPSAQSMIVAAGGGATVVFAIAAAIWWAVTRTNEPAPPPSPPQQAASPAVTNLAKAKATSSLGPIVPAENAGQYLSKRCTVELVVVRAGVDPKSQRTFLNSKTDTRAKDNFTVTFTKAVAEQYRAKGITNIQDHFKDKKVRVTGRVKLFNGLPEIEVDDTTQVQIVEG